MRFEDLPYRKPACTGEKLAKDLALDPEIEVMATVWVEEHWGVSSWPDGVDPILHEVVRDLMVSIRRALDRVRQEPLGGARNDRTHIFQAALRDPR